MIPLELEAIELIGPRLETISLADHEVSDPVTFYKRALVPSDPNLSIGMVFMSWTPRESPHIGSIEPILGRYTYAIQAYLKVAERELGTKLQATFTKRIRLLLYRDPVIREALGALRDEQGYSIERTLRYGVNETTYADSPFTGGFAFLSETTFFLETEVA